MNKIILGTRNRGTLFISILIAVVLIVLSYVIAQNMSSSDMKVLNINKSTSGGKVTGANPTAQNTDILRDRRKREYWKNSKCAE